MNKKPVRKTGGLLKSPMLLEDYWHNSFDVITDSVSLQDTNYKILRINKAFADTFHLTQDEVIGKRCYEIIHATKGPILNCPCKHALELKKNVIKESYEPLLDLHFEITAYPVFDNDNNPKGMLHFIKNITERKRAEKALRQSEERLRLAMLGATDGLWDRNLQTGEIYYSPRWKSMLGYTDEELENHPDTWKRLLHPDDREAALARVRNFTEGGPDKYEVEFRLRHKDGHYIDILSRGSLIRGAGGEALRLVGTHVDITYRKQAEEELRMAREQLEMRVLERTMELNSSNEQLRHLAAHLLSVREEERMKIAREVHDELGQMLSAQKMELSWFRDKYGDHKSIFDKAGAMLDALNAMMRSVRRICTELRPPILDDFGLVDSMQWYANEFQTKTRIECAVDSVPEEIKLDKERSTVLFRIFQETLSNVLKHSRATKVTTRLIKKSDNITLEVIDNGKGITVEQLSKRRAFGLISMRERVYPWGGKVEITGYKNKGTIVKVIIPDSSPRHKKDKNNLH